MARTRAGGRIRFVDDPEPEDPWGPEEDHSSLQASAVHQQQQAPQLSMQAAFPVQQHRTANSPQSSSHNGAFRSTPASARVCSSSSSTSKSKHSKQLHQPLDPFSKHRQHIPSLQQFCLGVLGRHVTELVEQLDGQLGFLPADAKAALLAVARRRGELTAQVLSALADLDWTQLDLSWCKQLYAAEVLQAAPLMPNNRVLDVSGFELLAAGGWKQFARAWPGLSVIRLGGTAACTQEALKALPHILPGITQPAAPAAAAVVNQTTAKLSSGVGTSGSSRHVHSQQQDLGFTAAAETAVGSNADAGQDHEGLGTWEDAFASESDDESDTKNNSCCNSTAAAAQGGTTAPAAAAANQDCRLKQLRALIWPDVPPEALQLVQQRCPKVLINPPMKRDKITGQLPPVELDESVALDQPYLDLVGPQALQDLALEKPVPQQGSDVVSIADKFREAYIQQAARLREKERRLRQQEQRRQLRSSHALRTLNAWLDEPA